MYCAIAALKFYFSELYILNTEIINVLKNGY